MASEEISILAEIDRLVWQTPFEKFAIIMASGQRYDVHEHDAVAVGSQVVSVMPHRGGQHLLRQSHITEVSMPGDAS